MRSRALTLLTCVWISAQVFAQTNTFPSSGNVGVGTTTPTTLFQVNGGTSQFGGAVNYARFLIDGDLTFTGTADYLVGGDRYAFRYSGNQNFGLFFSASNSRFEFRDGSASQVFWITGAGNAYIKNKLHIGSTAGPGASLEITPTAAAAIKVNAFGTAVGSTGEIRFQELSANGSNYVGFKAPDAIGANKIWVLPSTDGTSGQILRTNGAGVLSWVNDANSTYTAGSGLSLVGTMFSNTAPDQVVTLLGGGIISISGTYPNFTISASESDPVFNASPASAITTGYITHWNDAYNWGDHADAGYLTSYTETDPLYNASLAADINATDTSNWNAAYSWGDHAEAGYLTEYTETDPLFNASLAADITATDTSNWNAAYNWGDHALEGYLTEFTESDPIYNASPASGISSTDIVNWNDAYTWGDHAEAGYLTEYIETDPLFNASLAADITGTDTSNWNAAYGWGDHAEAGYLTEYTETDPLFNASLAADITATDTSNWNAAYGWGDHAEAGYLTEFTETDPQVGSTNLNYIPKWNGTQLVDGSIYDNGTNIGIGTNTPTYKLQVTEDVSFNQVRVGRGTGSNTYNTLVGDQALSINSSGTYNTAVGWTSMMNNTGGHGNTAVGASTLKENTIGVSNTAMGNAALATNSTGHSNSGFGSGALNYNTTGIANTALGVNTLHYNAAGSNNTAVGFVALRNSNASNNTALGYQAGFNNTSGEGNLFLGYDAGYNETGSNKLYIANSATNPPLIYGDFATAKLGLGTITPDAKLHVAGNVKIVDGTQGAGKVLTSDASGLASWQSVSYTETDPVFNVSIASDITAADTSNWNAAYGWGDHADSGYLTEYIETDPQVGSTNLNYIPKWNGTQLVDGSVYDNGTNVGIGTITPGYKLDVNGDTRINGLTVGLGNGNKPTNTVLGNEVLINNTTGQYNTAIGYQPLHQNTTGIGNTVVGYQAGYYNTTGSSNTLLGYASMLYNNSGNYNVALGIESGYYNMGSGNVFLGYQAGKNASGSNQLYVANSEFGLPLIYGDFATKRLGLGTTSPTATLHVAGNVKIVDGTQSAGKVLTSDASGLASWQSVSYTETDPVFNISIASDITAADTSNWNAAYSWGDHADAGYLTEFTETDPQVGSTGINSVPKWNGTSLVDGSIYDDGMNVGIGTTSPTYKLEVTHDILVNGIPIGKGTGSSAYNVRMGQNNLSMNTSGEYNTALGTFSLMRNTTGSSNTAAGYAALYYMNTGSENTGLGNGALYANTSGSYNVAIGEGAGRENLGSSNVFLGYYAGFNESGSNKLYIANSSANPPLIYGDFATAKLGLGTITPDAKLHVVGDVKIVDGTQGTGKVLTSDANGLASWQNVAFTETDPVYNVSIASDITATDTSNWNAAYSWGDHADAGYLTEFTETDPQVGSTSINSVPKWNGTSLVDGSIYDDGEHIGIGLTDPAYKLDVAGNARFNGMTVGIGNGELYAAWVNTAVGIGTLESNTIGHSNAAIGYHALYSNTTGSFNTALGTGSLEYNTEGALNTAIGYQALNLNTVGALNTALGFGSMATNTTGAANTSLGYQSLNANTTGYWNTALGADALAHSTTGNDNTALGNQALYNNETGSENTAVGAYADISDSSLVNATAIGAHAIVSASNSLVLGNNANVGIGTSVPEAKLHVEGNVKIADGTQGAGKVLTSDANGLASWQNVSYTETDPQVNSTATNIIPKWDGTALTDGQIYDDGNLVGIGTTTPTYKLEVSDDIMVSGVPMGNGAGTGQYNVIMGENNLSMNTTGGSNTALGTFGLMRNTSGSRNTAVGYASLYYMNTGNDNTSIGEAALYANTAGSYNTALGKGAGGASLGSSNVFLGYNAGNSETGSNKLYIANSSANPPLIYGDFATAKLGLGTITPDAKLHVAGNVKIVDGTQGAGKVLTSDASGLASWQSVSYTETDPQVSSTTTNKVPKWNGTTLTDGLIYDSGANVGVGTSSPAYALDVNIGTNPTNGALRVYAGPGGNGRILLADGDVNHGMTSFIHGNDVFGNITAASDFGGLTIIGASETYNVGGIELAAAIGSADPNDATPAIQFTGNKMSGTYVQALGAAETVLGVRNYNGTNSFVIKGNGNVGIGTTNPTAKLQVENYGFSNASIWGINSMLIQSQSPSSRTLLALAPNGAQNADLVIFHNSDYTTNWESLYFGYENTATQFNIGTQKGGTGIQRQLVLDATGVSTHLWKQLVLATSGNVGIGITAPDAKLHVAGNLKIVDGTQGAGKVLTSDASGLASWQTVTVSETDPQVSSATTNKVPKWNGTTLTDGLIYDNGTNIGIGTTSPSFKLEVTDDIKINGLRIGKGSGGVLSNTVVGYQTLLSNTTGLSNTAIGYESLKNNTIGGGNTAIGQNSLINNTNGGENVAIGGWSMQNNVSGVFNTTLGALSDVTSGNLTNATAIGHSTTVDASNKVRIGNSSVSSIGGQVSWTSFSDERMKKDIRNDVPGLEFINQLKPVTYHIDLTKQNELMGMADTTQWEGKYDIEKINFTGFLAQEVDEAAQRIGYDFSGIDKTGSIMGLRYSDFVVPLTKAAQELDATNKDQDEEIATLQATIAQMQEQIEELTELIQSGASNDGAAAISIGAGSNAAILGQNIPNPYDQTTLIPFRIPKNCNDAYMMITDQVAGRVVTVIPISCNETHIVFEAGELPSGAYTYSLFVDGQLIGTKEMILTR